MFEARYQRRDAVLQENHGLHRALHKYSDDMKGLTPQKRCYPLRIAVVALAAFAILAIVLACKGISFQEFGNKIKHLMHTQIGWKAGVIMGSVGLLVGGAAFILYRVTRGKGKFWGDAHYKPVVLNQATLPGKEKIYWAGGMNPPQQLVDMSCLKDGSGTTQAYQRKVNVEHEIISVSAALTAPLQAIGSVVYNTIRFVVIPFYILGRMAQEKYTGKAAYEGQRKFRLSDIPKQMALSVYWAVRAPFYATAYLFSALYSFIDPMGGRKMGQLVSNAWMEGIDRHESVWTCYRVEGYNWEGGGGPEKLGRQAYFWTGCWMPWATVEVDEGAITRAYYPGEIFEYDIYEQSEHGHSVPDLMERPQMTILNHPIDSARQLSVGHYRYVNHEGDLFITAHVTKSDGQRLFLARRITKKPKDVDALLNETIRNQVGWIEEGEQTQPLLHTRNSETGEGEILPGQYRMVRHENKLYRQTAEGAVEVPIMRHVEEELHSQDRRSFPKEAVYHLELGQWRQITVYEKTYIIAHIQDEWGNHLFITKKVLADENPEYINPFLKRALKRCQTKEEDFFGFETDASKIRRASLIVDKRELQ